MATTKRCKSDADAGRSVARWLPCANLQILRVACVPLSTGAALLLLCVGAPSALAQQWSIDTSVSSGLTWSSNTTLGGFASPEDLSVTIQPRFVIRGEGARLRVAGSAALTANSYANGTQPSRVQPEADLNARLEAVERWLYLEAALRALQISQNPFGANPNLVPNPNRVTTAQLRLSPYIEATTGPYTRYRISSDNTKTTDNGSSFSLGASSASGYFGRHRVFIEHDPQPLGWRLEAERSNTRFDDKTQQDLVTELARASLDYSSAMVSRRSETMRTGGRFSACKPVGGLRSELS
jgi:uncharacterized protein (PEP-CTERM system associated)